MIPREMSAALESTFEPRPAADLDPEVDQLIERARAWAQRKRAFKDRLPGYVVGGTFILASIVIAAAFPALRTTSVLEFVLFIAAYALASRIEFEVGPCLALPTQLILVPMLFTLPLRLVPPAVATGLLLGDAVTASSTWRCALERVPLRLANAWHSVGPVLVLAAFGAPAPTWENAPIILLAFAAQFVFDFTSTATLEYLRVGVSPRSLVRYAVWAYAVDLTLAGPALAVAYAAQESFAAVVLVLPLVGLLAFFARERRVRIDHALELGKAYRGTALLLGDVVEADDAYTGEHSRDVVGLVLAVADRLGLDARDRRNAEFAALLHDVGKVHVPGDIINKPGPLDEAEREVIKRHTIDGQHMLERVGGLLGDVGRIVRSCHEHWDGSGYPDGLKGQEIPLVARIVCACDAFSAMTTTRSYRRALSQPEALAELERCSGTQFDPRVVETLLAVAGTVERAA
jgi:HD-GYP domain-containing protein (c-di-GMP phosphodiesterase class II)